jgi:hypothetical protein
VSAQSATSAATPRETVLEFFSALQAGDVTTVRSLLRGNAYERRKILLEQNQQYGSFLVSHYQGVSVEVIESEIDDKGNFDDPKTPLARQHGRLHRRFTERNQDTRMRGNGQGRFAVVTTRSRYPNGSSLDIEHLLYSAKKDNRWFIVNQIMR